LSEYNSLASWLRQQELTPADLLDRSLQEKLPGITIAKLDSERLFSLLNRGFLLGLALEKWLNQGLWIIGRGEDSYPQRLKQKLKHLAPPIIYGIGDRSLLSLSGLAIIGSRDVDAEGLDYTRQVAQECVKNGLQVVSGGARGVDRTAMLASLEAGGTALGILADSLVKTAVRGDYRPLIQERKLTLISTYDPEAGFSVGNAMGRNKYIYALADHSLVVSATANQGGTWHGEIEALEKIKNIPVFVRLQGNIPDGNQQLINRGAKAFPVFPLRDSLGKLLTETRAILNENDAVMALPNEKTNIYEAVLPIILQHLNTPQNLKSLVADLGVREYQLKDWLELAVKEGKVKKNNKKSITYEIERSENLLSLLESPH
jgi:predicted Rossmann fold nucleotide-binding protein DprA/Smf involved in DNA uptake